MAAFQFYQFSYNTDNYGVLIHDPATGQTACVDAGDAAAYETALAAKGWSLTQIWITHHHADHTAGLMKLKETTGAKVFGPAPTHSPISGLDENLKEGDRFVFGGTEVQVLETPGHTLDMLNFYVAEQGVVFTGDTLFALGCGRLFEGSPAQMWGSLDKLMALPDETVVYCSHEYTKANADFALSIDPGNAALVERAGEIAKLRAANKPTVPTTIGLERATNPFVRPQDTAIRSLLDLESASNEDVFAEIRRRKDNF